jgi:hypothetical protein
LPIAKHEPQELPPFIGIKEQERIEAAQQGRLALDLARLSCASRMGLEAPVNARR